LSRHVVANETQIAKTTTPIIPGIGLSELETFIVVAELGSFSKAAERMHLSQPAVTTRVKKLEALLGTKLLLRTTRNVVVTRAGELLAARASEALQSLRVVLTDMATDKATARRRVNVTSTPMLAATLLPRAIRLFVERYPDVQVAVSDLRYTEAIASLQRGDSEIGFMALDRPHPTLRFEPLITDDLVLVVPGMHSLAAKKSITLTELAPYPIMVLEQYVALRAKVSDEFAHHGLRFLPMVTAGNLLTLLGMVDAGNGIALLPSSVAQLNAMIPRATVRILGNDLVRRYGIVVRKKAKLSVVTRNFCDFLRSTFGQKPST